MEFIKNIKDLEALYGTPGAASTRKVVHRLTPLYRQWIMTSRYCVLSTVGPDGTDCSPRADDGPVVLELDEDTLAMPDWRGNNRLDSLTRYRAKTTLLLSLVNTEYGNHCATQVIWKKLFV